MGKIELAFYEPGFYQALCTLRLDPERKKFTSEFPEVLATLTDRHRHLVVILNDGAPVGYFVLHEKDGPLEFGSHEKALLLRSLAVNGADQGRGYASAAMAQLPAFVRTRFPEITEVILLVNYANFPAQRLYRRAGFTDTGHRWEGKVGELHLYRLDLIKPVQEPLSS